MSEEELEESIDWHAEEHIPFDVADVSLDYQIVGSGHDSLHVLMAACKRDFVANLKQAIQLAGRQPVIIDVDAFALQNCYEVNYEPSDETDGRATQRRGLDVKHHIFKGVRAFSHAMSRWAASSTRPSCRRSWGFTEQAEPSKRSGQPRRSVARGRSRRDPRTFSDMLALESPRPSTSTARPPRTATRWCRRF